MRSFSDPETTFEIVGSESPPTVDGLAIGEPKFLECATCGASVRIDGPDEHQTAIDDLPHDKECPQRDVVSEWFVTQYVR